MSERSTTRSDARLLESARDLNARLMDLEKYYPTTIDLGDDATDAYASDLASFEDAVIATRATSMAGLIAKARSIRCIHHANAQPMPEGDSQDERLVWSILRDILAIDDV